MAGDVKCEEPFRLRQFSPAPSQEGRPLEHQVDYGARALDQLDGTRQVMPSEFRPSAASPSHVDGWQPNTAANTPSWKRLLDITGALILLILLAPLLLTVGVFIKLTSAGPIFFRQNRFGRSGRPFRIWKFRTMRVNVDPGTHGQHVRDLMNSGQSLQKLDVPQGLIPCGKWLRRSAIDELPQLFNVLKGEMSLVGPRPDVIPPHEYQDRDRKRFESLPGLTGLWQVSGKNKTTFEQMIDLDIEYVSRCSPLLDLRILLMTGPAIILQLIDSQIN